MSWSKTTTTPGTQKAQSGFHRIRLRMEYYSKRTDQSMIFRRNAGFSGSFLSIF
jgi:hypothetical protein